ncbi:SDR family oxidoreductase [Hansschlegelia beijingensis]|uniref:Nucleoside-diphosphate-sugar epimerase n=1 Tax=Hansschlegelia beijingensis TaxID=1133344 RepID=A0A7W6CXH4_9HYPH|nr:SDR family oxidoreductase [Hansschlegelia beijingensis]MBB3972895.1 nucleoside-diphosphate-sugar epimerase [Hansschlegelia beijingensis]
MKRLVVFGCGYSARRFVELHRGGFDAVDVTTRSEATAAALRAEGLRTHLFDGGPVGDGLRGAIAEASHVLVSAPPDAAGDPTLRGAGEALQAAGELRWVGYLSTIGVYPDAGGGWVDEATPPDSDSDRGRRRVTAEGSWLAFGAVKRVQVQIFRLAGIYGPGRGPVEHLRAGTAKRLVKQGQVFNRIHVDDIAAAIAAGIERPLVGPVINVTDDEPAPPQDVIAYAAELMGVAPPPETAFETAELSPMQRSFYSSNKRVANRVLRERLGVQLAYPTYREGMAALAR